jgi:hypothetical protein
MNLRTVDKLWFKILGDFVTALPPFFEDFDTLLPLYRYLQSAAQISKLEITSLPTVSAKKFSDLCVKR